MKFNGTILIIGDLGQLKAYRVAGLSGMDRQDSAQVSHMQHRGTEKESTVLELITDVDYVESHKKTDDLVSDQAGRFGGRLGTSMGEAHDTVLERDRRTLKAISEEIKTIIDKESPRLWHLAFPKDTHNKLVEMLSADIKKTLKKTVPSDLTKIAKNKLLSHFE
jgi:hypothetical protein